MVMTVAVPESATGRGGPGTGEGRVTRDSFLADEIAFRGTKDP